MGFPLARADINSKVEVNVRDLFRLYFNVFVNFVLQFQVNLQQYFNISISTDGLFLSIPLLVGVIVYPLVFGDLSRILILLLLGTIALHFFVTSRWTRSTRRPPAVPLLVSLPLPDQTVAFRTNLRSYLYAEALDNNSQPACVRTSLGISKWEEWTIGPASTYGMFVIKSRLHGTYMHAPADKSRQVQMDHSCTQRTEMFRLILLNSTTFALNTHHDPDTFVRVARSVNHLDLVDHIGLWQQYQLTNTDGSDLASACNSTRSTFPFTGWRIALRNVTSGHYLCVDPNQPMPSSLCAKSASVPGHALWTLVPRHGKIPKHWPTSKWALCSASSGATLSLRNGVVTLGTSQEGQELEFSFVVVSRKSCGLMARGSASAAMPFVSMPMQAGGRVKMVAEMAALETFEVVLVEKE